MADISGPLQLAIETRINHATSYRGVPARKMPTDAWAYQEIIHETRPDVIVEVGNRDGGSTLYLADVCELIGHGRVVGVDIDHSRIDPIVAAHPRVTLVEGDALEVYPEVAAMCGGHVLVIEDSAHTYDHTLAVLRTYGQLVAPGGYLICEDGLMPAVAKALRAFAKDGTFEADAAREWPITWNPAGFLRRVK